MFCFCCHPSKRLCSSVFLWGCLFSIQMCLFFSVCLSICLYVAFLPFKVLVSIQFILLNVVLFAADAVLLIMEDCSSNIFLYNFTRTHAHTHMHSRNTLSLSSHADLLFGKLLTNSECYKFSVCGCPYQMFPMIYSPCFFLPNFLPSLWETKANKKMFV